MCQIPNFLPADFQNRIKRFPGIDVAAFFEQYAHPPYRGVLRNPLKCGEQILFKNIGVCRNTPFGQNTYYMPENLEGVGKLPLHHAGGFYVQEPSAASAVSVLAPEPGDRVLDLCAAPGGKSAQIAARLQDCGLLWSNEIVRQRAQILLSNLERLGVRNAVVSSCHPQMLCQSLRGYFDKVLVDAPCSGEGMFRRDPRAAAEWSTAHVETCAVRQSAILESAKEAVRPGGILVYSTCTFSPEENEGVADTFLANNPDFYADPCGVSFGRPALPELGNGRKELEQAGRRIFPMDGGEGHFVVRFRRRGEAERMPQGSADSKEYPELENWYKQIFFDRPWGYFWEAGGRIALTPENLPPLEGKGVLRAGVWIAERAKGRLEPCHGLFAAANPLSVRNLLKLDSQEERTAAFLRGEEIECELDPGFAGVAVDGVMLGFGKVSGGRLKNRYPKGLRNFK